MTCITSLTRRQFIGYGGATFAFAPDLIRKATAAAAVFATTRARVAAAARAMLSASDVPSLTYALIGRDGVIWSEVVGILDKEANTAPGGDTLYGVGSCSKVFAVAAVMRLAEQGKLDIDRPFVSYVPEFRMLSEDYDKITLRMLMSHSSGLPGGDYRGGETMVWHGDYPRQAMATAAFSRLKHKPGEMSVYCNDGFTLLEILVAAVAKTPYPDFVEREILAPLGMTRSCYGNRPIAPGDFAPGYDDGRRLPLNVLNMAASGGLYTTAAEWGRFLALFLNEGRHGEKPILAPGSIRAMAENQTAREPFRPLKDGDGFGLGWDSVNPIMFASLGVSAWRKNGGTSVYASDMIVAPDAGLAVAVTGASPDFAAGELAERLMFEALVEQRTLTAMPAQLSGIIAPAVDTAPDPRFLGVFANYHKVLRFEADGHGGATQYQAEKGAWNKLLTGLRPRQDGGLASDSQPMSDFGVRDYEGFTFLTARFASGYRSHPVEMLGAQKLVPQAPLSAAWKNRLGRRWLLVNMPPESFLPGIIGPSVQLDELPELAGYLVFNFAPFGDSINQVVDPKGDELRARMCLKIPFNASRDLNDVVMLPRGDGEWLQYGSWVARPLESVPVIGRGRHDVTIGPEGHGEWRKLSETLGLDISGAAFWSLQAADLGPLANGRGDVTGLGDTHAGYVLVHGAAGSTVTITLS